jgi:hypothetical protein
MLDLLLSWQRTPTKINYASGEPLPANEAVIRVEALLGLLLTYLGKRLRRNFEGVFLTTKNDVIKRMGKSCSKFELEMDWSHGLVCTSACLESSRP